MQLYIQFRHLKLPNSSAEIGEVVGIYEVNEIKEPPSGMLSWVKITSLPNSQSKASLMKLLAGRVDKESAVSDMRRNSKFDFDGLPSPYKKEFDETRSVSIPFGVAVSLLYGVKLGRKMVAGDFG